MSRISFGMMARGIAEGKVTRLTLYGTHGCHLCEEAEALLHQALDWCPALMELQKIDIAEDAELLGRYGVRIPVLCSRDFDSELGWPFDAAQLQAFLQNLP
jgi:hypothetical protein